MAQRQMFALLLLLGIVARGSSYSCIPCGSNPDCGAAPHGCSYGIVKDTCGCCDECAKGPGEQCGSIVELGECGEGLKCVEPSDPNAPGICTRTCDVEGSSWTVDCNFCYCLNSQAFCTDNICLQNQVDCITDNGRWYSGKQNVTKDGDSCQRWDAQEPHKHAYTPDFAPEVRDSENHCRNPNGRGTGPWCYTTDERVKWGLCDVPNCDNLDSEQPECVDGTSWREECNTCTCLLGHVACTNKPCLPECVEGSSWTVDCNICKCNDGHASCSNKNCLVDPVSRCMERSRWTEDCNSCFCINGVSTCTKDICSSEEAEDSMVIYTVRLTPGGPVIKDASRMLIPPELDNCKKNINGEIKYFAYISSCQACAYCKQEGYKYNPLTCKCYQPFRSRGHKDSMSINPERSRDLPAGPSDRDSMRIYTERPTPASFIRGAARSLIPPEFDNCKKNIDGEIKYFEYVPRCQACAYCEQEGCRYNPRTCKCHRSFRSRGQCEN